MPELPDVEVFRRRLGATSLHRKIQSVHARRSRVLAGLSARALAARLDGKEFTQTRRRGKVLLAGLSDGAWLGFQFGMSGELYTLAKGAEEPAYSRVRVEFADGRQFAYLSRRKLGHVWWIKDVEGFLRQRRLGPDALEVGAAAFRHMLAERRGRIKSALMDQALIAGIGNIYSDEILFRAGIRPGRKTADLDDRARGALFRAMRYVLRKAIERRADPARLPRTFLISHRERGGKCPRCGAALRTMKSGGRRSYYCPRDQG